MTDIIDRLMGMGKLGPELTLQLLGMVIDGIGVGTEWSGEQLDQLGEMTQQLADKVRGIEAEE